MFEGDPCRVVEFRHHTPGNLRAMVQTKMKNLRTGSNFEHRFRAADAIEKADMETHELEFLYQGGDAYHFMNTENYDQIELDGEALGDNAQWMQPGMKILAEYYNGRPIGIQLVAPSSGDELLFELAHDLETAGPWKDRWPPMAGTG